MSLDVRDVFYLDTSALVKRYVSEAGTEWITGLTDPTAEALLATARISKAEAAAAFASKRRAGDLTPDLYKRVLDDLTYDCGHQYVLVEIDEAVVDLAVALTTRQPLRGYDAVQLAAALTLQRAFPQTHSSALTFVTADDDLLAAAKAEGLTTDNPNVHA